MKLYERPEAEIIDFAAWETVADEGADAEAGVTSNPFFQPEE